MKLIVGLGNPGKRYERTRHNIGFRVLDNLGLTFSYKKESDTELAKVGGVVYIKPQTFMNESGRAVRTVADYYRIAPEDIIVVYDDKDLPLGTIRLRTGGSGSGGHNGVQSVIEHLGSKNFARVRIGILPEHPVADTAGFVLSRFSKAEEELLNDCVIAATDAVRSIIKKGIVKEHHRDIVITVSPQDPQ